MTFNNNEHSCTEAEESNPSTPQWYTALKRPDWWLVIVASLTAIVIGWQSNETRRSAQAALLNAQAIINAERSWIIPKVGRKRKGLALSEVIFSIKNHGRTPARLVSLRYDSHRGPSESLPGTPIYREVVTATHLMAPGQIWDFCVFRPLPVEDIYVFGIVQYVDIFRDSVIHETAFCYRQEATRVGSRWVLDGPEGYNRYT